MKWLIVLLSVIVLIMGLAPLAFSFGVLPGVLGFIPLEGNLYYGIITLCGGILTYIGFKKL